MDKANLEYREGSSDKVYQIQIDAVATGFVVNFAYGRRGSTMNTGTKTSSPVPYAKAKKIFDGIVDEKRGKGYTDAGGSITVYANGGGDKRVKSGYKPQLLNPIEESDLESYFQNANYVMQEKMDGQRRLAKKLGDDVFGINRKGEVVPLPEKIATEMRKLTDCVIDGEILNDILFAFDMIELAGDDIRGNTMEERYCALQEVCVSTGAGLQVLKTYSKEAGKRKEFARIKSMKGEGVVFKERTAKYVAGRPNSKGAQVKFKLTASATCIVTERNISRSVAIACSNGTAAIGVGNVTIPSNFQVPQVGELVEVRYLYAFPNGGSLYQPVYQGPRPDKTICDPVSSLKLKPTSADDELA